MKLQLILLITAHIVSGSYYRETKNYLEGTVIEIPHKFTFVNGSIPSHESLYPCVAIYTVTTFDKWNKILLSSCTKFPPYVHAYWSGYMLVNMTKFVSEEKYEENLKVFKEKVHVHGLLFEEFYQIMDKMVPYVVEHKKKQDHYRIYLYLWFLRGVQDGYDKAFVTNSSTLTDSYLLEVGKKIRQLYRLNYTADFWASFNGVEALYITTYTTSAYRWGELTFRNVKSGLIIGDAPLKQYNPLPPGGITLHLWWKKMRTLETEEENGNF